MFIIYGSTREEQPGPSVGIHCPKCSEYCEATSLEITEWVKLFIVIPIFRLRNTYLKCTNCGKTSHVKLRLDELPTIAQEDLDAMLAGAQASFLTSFFAILAVSLCWLPVISLPPALISVLLSWKISGWQKILSYIALALSLTVTIFAISGWF